MINQIIKRFTGKEIALVHLHRNSIPIVEANRDRYIFFDPGFIWKAMGIVGRRRKLRYRLMYLFLDLVKPAWIIDINWLDKLQSLYLVWANHHNKQFIVIQHGIYYGGIMRDIPEKYIKCNIMLVWSDYFKRMFLENNPGKQFRCITFGNPIYNQYSRKKFSYSSEIGKKVLLCPSLISGKRLERFYMLLEKLVSFGFKILIKEHKFQSIHSESIKGYKKTSGDDFHLYRLLESQGFDIVITDISSAMTDIIFFKKHVIYFSPEFEGVDYNENIYGEYLPNLDDSLDEISGRDELLSFIDLESQEQLLKRLIKVDHLSNDLYQIAESNDDEKEREDSSNMKFK